jgi:hypothetical protein
MTVRAKFIVSSIQHIHSSEVCAEITLRAVWGDGKGNEAWSKATPQGELKMMITNPTAIDEFFLGKPYFLDISLAEPCTHERRGYRVP